MIVMCPGCSGIELDVIKREFKDEKIVCGCIGECGGRMDETIVAMAVSGLTFSREFSSITCNNSSHAAASSINFSNNTSSIKRRFLIICITSSSVFLFFLDFPLFCILLDTCSTFFQYLLQKYMFITELYHLINRWKCLFFLSEIMITYDLSF